MNAEILVAIAASAAITALVVVSLQRSSWATRLVDRPNERSLHAQPTPRFGGLGVMAGALAVGAFVAPSPLLPVLGCAALLAIVSVFDDVRSLPIEVRLSAHAAAAVVAVLALAAPSAAADAFPVFAALALAVAIVWMTNLFNFMDGSDGLAGAMALVGFGALALGASEARDPAFAAACAACAGAAAAFLAFNAPPARVFLGDCGAVPLGFLAAAFGAYGALHDEWPWWFPVLVFSPFIADASVTLLGRIARGEAFWRAHRGHAYQKLVLAGWSKARLLAFASALMLWAAASALLCLRAGSDVRFGILLGWLIAYVLIFVAVERIARSPVSK
jgi:UDP-N-acetylmuramyl pentapeptide phosphotransferase/UDP-N-acetylglucosamine-1-phosphate transferase